jgi:hypothetical protein
MARKAKDATKQPKAAGKSRKPTKPRAAPTAGDKPKREASAAETPPGNVNAKVRKSIREEIQAGHKPKGKGRPTAYSQEIGEEILRRMADGETLSEICRDKHMPNRSTVASWSMHGVAGWVGGADFPNKFARARDLQLDFFCDELIRISRDSGDDFIERKRRDGTTETAFNREHVERSKLRIQTLQWVMGRRAPHLFGDVSKIELTGKAGKDLFPPGVDDDRRQLRTSLLVAFRLQQGMDAKKRLLAAGEPLELEVTEIAQ